MKKIILLSIITLMYSCSDENNNVSIENQKLENVATRPLPPIETETDAMFYSYVTSDIYIEVKQLMMDFNEALNFDGFDEEIDTDEELFDWINNNIDQTNFTSISEAHNRWELIKNRNAEKVSQFNDIYDFILDAPFDEATLMIHKWLVEPVTSGSGGDNCDGKFDNCTRRATEGYILRSHSMEEYGSTEEKQRHSDIMFERDNEKCRNEYKKCLGI